MLLLRLVHPHVVLPSGARNALSVVMSVNWHGYAQTDLPLWFLRNFGYYQYYRRLHFYPGVLYQSRCGQGTNGREAAATRLQKYCKPKRNMYLYLEVKAGSKRETDWPPPRCHTVCSQAGIRKGLCTGAGIHQTNNMLQMLLSGYPTDLQKLPGKAG